jgi:hypothetical protein
LIILLKGSRAKKVIGSMERSFMATLEIKQDTVADKKCTGPEKKADYTKYKFGPSPFFP